MTYYIPVSRLADGGFIRFVSAFAIRRLSADNNPPRTPVPPVTDNSRLSWGFSRVLLLLSLSIFINYIDRSSICGWLRDRPVVAGETPTRVRKSFVVFGAVGMGLFLALRVVTPRSLSLIFLMLAGLAFGLSSSNLWVITQRIAGPEAAGRWTGIQNFMGNLAGTVVPAVTGFLLDWIGRFLWPFLIVSIFLWMKCFIVGLHRALVEPAQWGRQAGVPGAETYPA